MLELQNISAAYRKGKENRIIENTDLQLAEGEILGIIGKNGSGKSTLAKAIINQIPRKEGVIYFKGNDISNKPTFRCIKDGIGYFPQGGRIFHNLSMRENLTFAGRHLSKKERGKKLNGLSDFIPDIKDKSNSTKAGYLSGGKKNMLSLAMVLLQEPELLILDEPAAGLSDANAENLYNTLDKLLQGNKNKMSILIIEHRLEKLFKFADRVVMLKEKKIDEKARINKNMSLKEMNELYENKN